MNERIKELDLQAWTYAREKCPDYHGVTTAFSEKFAELIVKECVSILENSRIEGDESVCLVGATKCKIEQHFGVKE